MAGQRTRSWRRFPARSDGSLVRRRPPPVEVRVGFVDATALVEIINRQGSAIEVEVCGVSPADQVVWVSGNTKAALPFTVTPGAEVVVRSKGDVASILYQGTAPTGAGMDDPEDPDEQDERAFFSVPGGEPWDQVSADDPSGTGPDATA